MIKQADLSTGKLQEHFPT